MQDYGPGFARVYNLKWAAFATQVAPFIREFYEGHATERSERRMLDLCCGAGHLAQHFLAHDYSVIGIDLSEAMLHYARENNSDYVDSGKADFIEGDAADFSVDKRFDLVVSTYDSLNHLESEEKLLSCFECVSKVNDAYFIFDLNTRAGLKHWTNVQVDDSDDNILLIRRGFYDEAGTKAMMKITGFCRRPDRLFEQFEETVFNIAYDLNRVRAALHDTGYKSVHFARMRDLATPLVDPEHEGRVFVVAHK
jgi:ubiquinone/menaquinone biosynthesis C-methylase UbiE